MKLEHKLHVNPSTGTPVSYNLQQFIQLLDQDQQYVKIRLDGYSFGVYNSGGGDYATVSISINTFCPYVMGDDRNVLYRTVLYLPSTSYGTANDTGSTLKYLIVPKNSIINNQVFSVSFTCDNAFVSIDRSYALFTFIPMTQEEVEKHGKAEV